MTFNDFISELGLIGREFVFINYYPLKWVVCSYLLWSND